MQSAPPIRMPLVPTQSLPTVLGATRRVVVPDALGIDRSHAVSEDTLRMLRYVLDNAQHLQIQQQHSLGSLPSATSQYSTFASLGSQASATQGRLETYFAHIHLQM